MDPKKRNLLIVAGGIGIFVVIIGISLHFIFQYFDQLSAVRRAKQEEQTAEAPKLKIKKIRIRRPGSGGCLDLTPDGAVRIYKDCDGDVTSAQRLADNQALSDLFDKLSKQDLSTLPTTGSGAYYEVTIETENGTITIRLYLNSSVTSVLSLLQIITLLEQQIAAQSTPAATPTPVPASGGFVPTLTPINPFATPTPLPGGSASIPFTCDFGGAQGKIRPYNISNIVCSTGPTPVPQ